MYINSLLIQEINSVCVLPVMVFSTLKAKLSDTLNYPNARQIRQYLLGVILAPVLTSIMAFRSIFLSFILANEEKLQNKRKRLLTEVCRLDSLKEMFAEARLRPD